MFLDFDILILKWVYFDLLILECFKRVYICAGPVLDAGEDASRVLKGLWTKGNIYAFFLEKN